MISLCARPTVYGGVLMRSRLEAHFAQWFDEKGVLWDYEPRCFADETGQYLPDFFVVFPKKDHAAYFEVKGYPCDLAPVRRQMEIIWSSEPSRLILCSENPGQLWVTDGPSQPWRLGGGTELPEDGVG